MASQDDKSPSSTTITGSCIESKVKTSATVTAIFAVAVCSKLPVSISSMDVPGAIITSLLLPAVIESPLIVKLPLEISCTLNVTFSDEPLVKLLVRETVIVTENRVSPVQQSCPPPFADIVNSLFAAETVAEPSFSPVSFDAFADAVIANPLISPETLGVNASTTIIQLKATMKIIVANAIIEIFFTFVLNLRSPSVKFHVEPYAVISRQ